MSCSPHHIRSASKHCDHPLPQRDQERERDNKEREIVGESGREIERGRVKEEREREREGEKEYLELILNKQY